MYRPVSFLLLMLSTITIGGAQSLLMGSTAYIEPMDGYESYLTAAIAKKHVPLIVVAGKNKAA